MPKQKFNSHDIAASCATLRAKVLGAWLANIFDLDDKRTLLLKFTRSGGATESGEGEKTTVLLESGARFHTTSYARERKADQPSKFNAKLRMHLRGKRLNGVNQMGADRAVAFTFGAGDTEHHLVLELYAQGNIVLCDREWRILTLLRPHRDDARSLVLLGNHPYPRERFRSHVRVDAAQLCAALEGRDEADPLGPKPNEGEGVEGAGETPGVEKRRAPGTVREALCKAFGFGPPVVDRAARMAGIVDGGAAKTPLDDAQVTALGASLGAIDDWFEGVTDGRVEPRGVVTWRIKEGESGEDGAPAASPSLDADFEDFSPFPADDVPPPAPFDPKVFRTTEISGGFDAALDLFFASFEARRDRSRREKTANAAAKKLEKVRRDQEARVRALEKERESQELAATLIEYNLTQVDAVLAAVNGALAGGMAWDDLTLMIKEEARAGNPVARLVKTLDLPNNKVTVTLKNHLDVDDDEGDYDGDDGDGGDADDVGEGDAKPRSRRLKRDGGVLVELDLALGAHANAREHFDRKKKHDAKHGKTLAQNKRAVAAAEKKAKEAGARMASKGTGMGIARARVPEWFEKFHWFITTENCLVLSARDAAQADALVVKYLGPDDAFVHADSPGAPVTIVKAPPVRSPALPEAEASVSRLSLSATRVVGSSADGWCGGVPPVSLIQAGAACLCRSAAWDSRHVVSAFWIPPENVRKVTPDGDPLAPGVVWHVGAKTYLPPAPLVMGFGCVFLLRDEDGVRAHVGDRTVKTLKTSPADGVKIDVVADDDDEGDEEMPEDDDEEMPEEPDENGEEEEKGDGDEDDDEEKEKEEQEQQEEEVEEQDKEEEEEEEKEEEKEEEEEEEGEGNDDGDRKPDGKVRISAKERRMMKKQRKRGGENGMGSDDDADPIKPADGSEPQQQPQRDQQRQRQEHQGQQQPGNKPLPRGKSSKAKKAAKKYADQDDEDRELAIALARASGRKGKKGGSKKGGGKRGGGGGSSSDDDIVDPIAANRRQGDRRDRNDSNRDKASRRHGGNLDKKSSFGGGGGGGDGGGDGGEDDDAGVAEEGVAEEDPAAFARRDAERVARVDWFTGCPTFSDAIDFAVCVVAPYAALQSFRYKVKLTPGTQKKGKAGKQALDILCRAPMSSANGGGGGGGGGRDGGGALSSREEKERESSLDSSCKEMMRAAEGAAGDLARLMCGGGVKVSMPAGAAKAMNAGRKGKR